MKKILIPLSFVALSLGGYAQGGNLDLPTAYIRNTLSGNNALPDNVIGSMYLNDKFQTGKIFIDDKSFNSYIRYNAYKDEFETQNQVGEITTVLRRENVVVQMGSDTYQIYSYLDDDGNKRQGYMKKLNDGKNLLLIRNTVELIPGREATSTYAMDQPPKLEAESQYYIKVQENAAESIRLKKKDIFKIIQEEEFEDYVKDNGLKLNDEQQVLQALNAIQ